MNADFSRTLALLRQEKGISQRKAAGELGVSQALLSHYENGVREPGLPFVVRAYDYYHVSADYLLGRTLARDGTVIIDADALYDASEEKGSLRGSIAATLQKKLIVNTTSLLFELLGQIGSRKLITAAGSYLSGALYQLYRALYGASGGKEKWFSLSQGAYLVGAVDARMRLDRVHFHETLETLEKDNQSFPDMEQRAIAASFPGLAQSLTQVLHATEEQTKLLMEKE